MRKGLALANTLSLVQYGRVAASAEADYGTIANGNSRSVVFNAASQNIWVTKFSGILGRSTGTNATLRFSAYDTDGSMNPRTRIGDSAPATASAAYTGPPPGSTIGARVDALVETSDVGPSNAGIPLFSGKRYAVDLVVRTADLAHSMRQASAITADNKQFYNRTGAASPPPSAYGSYTANIQGHMTVWMEGWANVAPIAPATGLAPAGSISSTAPTFTADFRDLNGAYGASSGNGVNTGDQLNQYQIQVRRVSDQVLFWNASAFTATSAEKTANAVSKAYGGTTLVRGTAYEWRVRQSDFHATWSDWSAWTAFTPVSLGFVTLDNTPTGKVNAISGSTTLDFHGRWNHQTAATMTLAQVQLLDGNGTLLQTGAQAAPTGAPITSSALPGTLFTATWAQTGFSALGWGRSYQYQIRGYDGSQWSDWSAPRSFTTDAAPTVPANLSPNGTSTPYTSFPLLRGDFSDADDTYAGALTGVMRITRPDTTTVDVTPTYNTFATHAPWQFQTTAVHLNQFGVYSWMMTGYDGALYSGESTTLAGAVWSSPATFDYESGPVVGVTSPADGATIATSSLRVSWTVSSGGPQAKYQVKVYLDGTSTVVYDSGVQTSTATFHVIPSGYLRNGVPYDLVVAITNATPLTGSSSIVNITVAFPAPTPVANPSATAIQVGTDPFATAIRVTADQTSYSSPQFVERVLTRRADGGPDAAQVVLARFASPTDIAFVDYTPASDCTYTYGWTDVILTGVDLLESAPVEASASVNLAGSVLSLHGNGGTYRAVLLNVTDRDHDRQINEAVYPSLSGQKPTTIRSKVRYWQSTFSALVLGDAQASADQRLADFDALDAQDGVVVYRDGLGRKRFCKITNFKITDQKPGDWWAVSFGLREENASEGEN